MNKHIYLYGIVLSIVLLFTINVQAEELGQVYYNGEFLEPLEGDQPYVFTGAGGDTLYLNGIPYDPVRKPFVVPGQPKKVSQKYILRHELRVRASEHANQGQTYEERLNLMAEIFRASPLVDSVQVKKGELCIYWKGESEGIGMSLRRFEPVPFDRLACHKRLQEGFWRIFNKGGLIAFSEKGYLITAPRVVMLRTQKVMDKLRKGESLTREGFKGTVLWNSSFREEYEAKHNISDQKKLRKE